MCHGSVVSHYLATAFTPAVRAAQEQYGSRAALSRWADQDDGPRPLGAAEQAFLAEQDGFSMASVSSSGWPYVQWRGGPPGFLRVLDDRTLGWADFRGNRQYLSVGNAASHPRVALLALDHARQQRLKVAGRLSFRDAREDTELVEALTVAGYDARVERAAILTVEAFDWNCPQHITPRFTGEQIVAAVAPLHERIAELEAQIAALRTS